MTGQERSEQLNHDMKSWLDSITFKIIISLPISNSWTSSKAGAFSYINFAL